MIISNKKLLNDMNMIRRTERESRNEYCLIAKLGKGKNIITDILLKNCKAIDRKDCKHYGNFSRGLWSITIKRSENIESITCQSTYAV